MLDRRVHFLGEKLDEHIKELTRERDQALAEAERLQQQRDISWKEAAELREQRDKALAKAERYHVASLGMFDPVRVGEVVAQLQMERDQARRSARAFRRLYLRTSGAGPCENMPPEMAWLDDLEAE